MKDYFNIEEGQKINSIQDVYLTYTTIMINLIDTETYENMMVNVCLDILKNDEMVETIKKLKRKQRLFLAPIIYNWAKQEWSNYPRLPQTTYTYGTSFWGSVTSTVDSHPFGDFLERLEEAFHTEIYEETVYQYHASKVDLNYTVKNNKYNIVMYEYGRGTFHRETYGNMVIKYYEKTNILRISYIENLVWNHSRYLGPQHFKVEMFRTVRKIMNELLEKNGVEPELVCNKKYHKVFEQAKVRGYLKKKKERLFI